MSVALTTCVKATVSVALTSSNRKSLEAEREWKKKIKLFDDERARSLVDEAMFEDKLNDGRLSDGDEEVNDKVLKR